MTELPRDPADIRMMKEVFDDHLYGKPSAKGAVINPPKPPTGLRRLLIRLFGWLNLGPNPYEEDDQHWADVYLDHLAEQARAGMQRVNDRETHLLAGSLPLSGDDPEC